MQSTAEGQLSEGCCSRIDFILLIGSGYNSARGAAKSNDVDIDVTDLFSGNLAFIVAMWLLASSVIAIALLFNVVLNIFSGWESVGSRMPKSLCRLQIRQCRMCDIYMHSRNGWTFYWARDVHERFVYIFVDTALYYSGHHQGI